MRLRRKRLLSVLKPDEIAPSVAAFPLMGVGKFTDPDAEPGVGSSTSSSSSSGSSSSSNDYCNNQSL